MNTDLIADLIDVHTFALSAGQCSSRDSLEKYPRLAKETTQANALNWVEWQAVGEQRADAQGVAQTWLHLRAQTALSLTCQRCLQPVVTELAFARSFLFADDEATAAQWDEERDEDVLVASTTFNLSELIEDEFLMELVMSPAMHETCPVVVPMQAIDTGFEAAIAEKPHPFAVLSVLHKSQNKD